MKVDENRYGVFTQAECAKHPDFLI